MRIGSEAPKRRTHSSNRHESQGPCRDSRHLEPSSAPRHKRTDKTETVEVTSASSIHCAGRKTTPSRYNALPNEPPQGNQKLARQGHDHGLAAAAGVLGAGSKPLRQGAVLLEHEQPPRQLNHASSNPSIARSGQPFLPGISSRSRRASQ